MLNSELITKLEELDPNAEIIVWEGYDAGCTTREFQISSGIFFDTNQKYYLLEA